MSEVTTEQVVKEYTEDDDHEKFSHYVRKDLLEQAIFDGIPCKALCGKLWLPTRDPKKFPVCPACKEEYLRKNNDVGDSE